MEKKRGFWTKASDLQKFVTFRILHWFFQDWKPEKFWPWGCDPPDRNFCHFWITEISDIAEFFQNFFLKSRFFEISMVDFFAEGGALWQNFFFWGDRPFLGVKPHGRPKSRTGPPQPSRSRFWHPRIEKSHFFNFFNENFSFLEHFCSSLGKTLKPEISSSNKSSKIDL